MLEDLFGGLLKFLIGISALYTFITYLFRAYSDFGLIRSQWHHLFENQKFSVDDFYISVNAALKKRNIEGIIVNTKDYSQGSMLAGKRKFLRVAREEQMILVCGAPFGNGFFISWRDGEWMNFFEDLIPRLPFIGKGLARWLFSRTYYQEDTANMFLASVRNAVHEVIDEMTTAKGLRPLSEAERRPEYILTPLDKK